MPRPRRKSRVLEWFEGFIEKFLWNFRLIIFLGVVGLLLSSLVVFILGLVETFQMGYGFVHEMSTGKAGHFKEPVHLLYFGGGIALIALALKFSHGHDIDVTRAEDKPVPWAPKDDDESDDD